MVDLSILAYLAPKKFLPETSVIATVLGVMLILGRWVWLWAFRSLRMAPSHQEDVA